MDNTILLTDRANQFIEHWLAYQAGDSEIIRAFGCEYLAANLVEQVARVQRLGLRDSSTDALLQKFSAILDRWRDDLLANAIKGTEPETLLPLLDSVVESLKVSLEVEETPELDHDLWEQLTDCLVKRDDLELVGRFVQDELSFVSANARNSLASLLKWYKLELDKIDVEFKKNLDVFGLVHRFCEDYAKANRIENREQYWWLFEPIQRVEEAKIISMLSLKKLILGGDSSSSSCLAPYVNASVSIMKLLAESDLVEEKVEQVTNHFAVPVSEEREEQSNYALAAKTSESQSLEPGIYVLVVHERTNNAEHHRIVGLVGSSYKSERAFDGGTRKVLEEIPTIAEGTLGIKRMDFTIAPVGTPEGIKGESLGLAAFFEYLSKTKFLDVTTPIAATGVLELDGSIRKVDHINEKIERAIKAGFPIIIVPDSNRSDISLQLRDHASLRVVSDVKQAVNVLRTAVAQVSGKINKATDLLRKIKVNIGAEGCECSEILEGSWHYFVDVSRGGEKAKVLVYYDKHGIPKQPTVQGPANGSLVQFLNKALERGTLTSGKASPPIFVRAKLVILAPETRQRIKKHLTEVYRSEAHEASEQGCQFRIDIVRDTEVVIKQYVNGTLTLEGKEGSLWSEVVSAVEACIQQKVVVESKAADTAGTQHIDASLGLPDGVQTWIGVDEAGKGDYFGPLVTAAVLVDETNRNRLLALGVRDSKQLSDQKNIDLGSQLREVLGDKCYVLPTMPEKYNELIAAPSFQGNSQRLLGWQHRRSLENILNKYECEYAVCDKFGSEYFINEGLKTGKGAKITIVQLPKAESNLGVAAASILARREYLTRMQKMDAEYAVIFPKGSSDFDSILKVAKHLIEKHGQGVLNKIAKVHFKTTKRILESLG